VTLTGRFQAATCAASRCRDERGEDALPGELTSEALARFGLPPDASVTFLRHGENTTYRVTAAVGRRFALRIGRPGYQTELATRSELAWMEDLRSCGVRTARAVPGIDGDPLQTVSAPGGPARTAVLFEWIDGVPLSAVEEVEPWARLGELMARIHEHARTWTRPEWFTRPAWDADALVGDEPRWGPPDPERVFSGEDRAALEDCRAEVFVRLRAIGAGADRFGLIHADLGFENALVADDGTVTILDFDDSGDSWYMHELAGALYPYDRSEGLRERRDALVSGYRRVRELAGELLAELPTFLMARRIQTLGWVFSRAETAHAGRQRPGRIQSTPQATREYLAWARSHPYAEAVRAGLPDPIA
jgi:Ser/Thr protein kinase RdoA (MazF antagonist)